jgi:hypothetical protein
MQEVRAVSGGHVAQQYSMQALGSVRVGDDTPETVSAIDDRPDRMAAWLELLSMAVPSHGNGSIANGAAITP